MKKISLIILIVIVLFSCKENKTSNKEIVANSVNNKIEEYLKQQQKIHEIPGMAVAVIKNNETIYKGYFGVENLETKKSVDSETIFPVYSVTKLITATVIFKLVEDGKIKLNDTIDTYIDNLPLKWRNRSIQNLLTHSSGLPDFSLLNDMLTDEEMLSEIKNKKLLFNKGEKWRYNQTNYWFLAKIIEKVTKKEFKNYIEENQFKNIKKAFISSNFKNKVINRVTRYDFDNELKKYKNTPVNSGVRAHAANGLNISLDNFILWNKKFDNQLFIKDKTKQLMWKHFNFTNDDRIFANGWDFYDSNNTISYGFTGGVQTGFRKFVKDDLTIIFLSNGYKYYPVHNTIINHIAGLVDKNLLDKSTIVNEELTNVFLNKPIIEAIALYQKIKKENLNVNFETTINSVGYVFLRSNDIEKAITIFRLNTKEYPISGNVFDSLGEVYFVAEKYSLSIENYEKAIALNPKNENAKMMLEKIEKLITKK